MPRPDVLASFEGLAPAETLKRLCAPSHDAAIDRLTLGPHTLSVAKGSIVFAAPLQLPFTDVPLTLAGAVPSRRGAQPRFTTSPPFTFCAGSLTITDAFVEVATQTGADRVRETRVLLRGDAGRIPVAAPLPRPHELLQLSSTARRDVTLAELAPLAGGEASWEGELDARLQRTAGWTLVNFALDVAADGSMASAARFTLRTKACSLAVAGDVRLTFPRAELRWSIGFPGSPQRMEHVELEAKGLLMRAGRRIVDRPFDATLAIRPAYALHALAERVTPDQCARIATALGLGRVPGPPLSRRHRWTAGLTADPASRLEASDEEERIAVWQ